MQLCTSPCGVPGRNIYQHLYYIIEMLRNFVCWNLSTKSNLSVVDQYSPGIWKGSIGCCYPSLPCGCVDWLRNQSRPSTLDLDSCCSGWRRRKCPPPHMAGVNGSFSLRVKLITFPYTPVLNPVSWRPLVSPFAKVWSQECPLTWYIGFAIEVQGVLMCPRFKSALKAQS